MKEQKFNQIVTENSELIKRICRYYNNNMQDQQDMYQEILINIWRSLDKFRGESKLSTFIYRIAVNVSITYATKSFKQSKLYVSADTDNLEELIDYPTEDKAGEEIQIQQLHTALNTLSVIDKALISLVLEGLSMKEIASVIGITEPNVKVKIHRIKNYLKEELTR